MLPLPLSDVIRDRNSAHLRKRGRPPLARAGKSSSCHLVVLAMCMVCGDVLACLSPHPPPFTSVPCRAVCCRMSWGAVSLVDPACITSSIVLASIYGMLGSQVLSLSHKSKPSKFYALSLRLGSYALRLQASQKPRLCKQSAAGALLYSLAGHTNFSRAEVGGVMGRGKNRALHRAIQWHA